MRLINRCLILFPALISIGCSALNASGLVDGFNVVTLGNFSSQNGDLQGTLAVGGNLSLQNYSLNQLAPVPNTAGAGFDTVSAGNFSMSGGTLYGKAYSATASFTNASICNGCSATGSNSPVDFASKAQSARNINSFLYHLTPTGSAIMPYSTLMLNASGTSSLQVFSITSTELSNNAGIDITNLNPGATVVINVSDSGSHSATTSAAGLAINGNLVQSAGTCFSTSAAASPTSRSLIVSTRACSPRERTLRAVTELSTVTYSLRVTAGAINSTWTDSADSCRCHRARLLSPPPSA